MDVQSTGSAAGSGTTTTGPDRTTARDPLDARDPAAARALAILGLAGLTAAAFLIGVPHLLPQTAGISEIRQTISEYALTDVAWMFNAAVIATAAASGAVLFALLLTRQATWRSIDLVFGGLWVAGLLVIVAFPKHNWAVGPSADGQIHRIASAVAFLSLPLAVMLLTRRARAAGAAGGRSARVAFWLGAGSLAWFSPLIVAMILAPSTGTPWFRAIPLGLIERGMVITEVAAIVALALWSLAATRSRVPAVNPPAAPERRSAMSTDPIPAARGPRRPAG